MYLPRPISFSFTGGTSARFFASRGFLFEDLLYISAWYTSNTREEGIPGANRGLAVGSRHY